MKCTKEKILKRLKEQLDYVIQLGYNEERILGIFLYGSQNYGFANENSDIDSKVIILPSFSDFCLKSKNLVSVEAHMENGEHIDIKDIRLLRENFMKQNINFTELLFTEYKILNPVYEDLFNFYFISQRENIVRFDQAKTIKSIGRQLQHTLGQGPTDNKKLYNSKRLFFFLSNYIQGKPYLECLQPKGEEHEYLWNLKYGLLDICSDDEAKKKIAVDLYQRVDFLLDSYSNIESPLQSKAQEALDTGVIEILKKSFNEISKEECSKKDFFKQLTHAEERAYYSIVSEIHAEGNITISKLVEKNRISRPVYNNLLVKMKENKIANIVNMGMKGTYIKILQPELKAEAIDFS